MSKGSRKGVKRKGVKGRAVASPPQRGRIRLHLGAAAAMGAGFGAAAGAMAAVAVKTLDGFKGVARGIGSSPPIGGSAAADPAAVASGGSGAAGGGDGLGVGGVALRFDVACLKPGATRDFLRARYPGPKPQFLIATETGIPADTVRKAMAWQGASELSGPHLMRMVSVFGPPFLAAVLDPVPRWVSDWMEATHG